MVTVSCSYNSANQFGQVGKGRLDKAKLTLITYSSLHQNFFRVFETYYISIIEFISIH